jgi:hypothetical protein
MPRKSIIYENTVMYKLVCNDTNVVDFYIGHTTDFVKRKSQHKSKSIFSTQKLYKTIRDNGGWDNWDMVIIEKFPCLDRLEALLREQYWYEQLKAKLNTTPPMKVKREKKYQCFCGALLSPNFSRQSHYDSIQHTNFNYSESTL